VCICDGVCLFWLENLLKRLVQVPQTQADTGVHRDDAEGEEEEEEGGSHSNAAAAAGVGSKKKKNKKKKK
jgi:hypothetical protein